ncbi:stalk domain-containing protein [Thermosediminibacter litoriperuensis]|uniref:Copper amine oxidase-like protein n=1 Tax=Thermosediminibacter litoriperuensis TaxID=291989 RepID=A0A5S5AIL1_9FIRM|nr:stalk domain-containing protein [Thermosediminibacter litoriperuensis]TYP49781.1 copper amine oxidase-like protein [Thermosediminibacter litoriperuensis]
MKSKVILAVCSVILAFTTVAIAASINGDFKGFPIVNVSINGTKIQSEIPAVNFYGKTLLPVRNVADTLQTIVEWDDKTWTANLVKPEVNMVFASSVGEKEGEGIVIQNAFKLMPVGRKNSFYTYTEIDGLKYGYYSFRIAVIDPQGNAIYSTGETHFEITKDTPGGFYVIDLFENIDFVKPGSYKFQVQVKHDGTYKPVYEKTLVVY